MTPPIVPIRKLLVANRGEIARRVMRTARSMGIACVAVCSDPDADAPHVREADEAVRLPGAAPADTYLNVDALVAAALAAEADAVHPGYGFLSEHAGFARACRDAGLRFVGPPPEVVEAMGSKLRAKAIMAEAGVPVLPTVTVDGRRPASVRAAVAEVGFPALVKASAGGGGRGMRIVNGPDELEDALTGAQREAASAFGDGTVFVEPYVERPRHVEVQILGDEHGTVVHLFERECSIQRRHQKIVEESPSPAVDDALAATIGEAAVTAGRTIGYVGAGTVEFLLLPDGRFAFLEVNTRLQVEHPVTELVTGLDLVRLQLLVAEGHPLPGEVLNACRRGHAIEVRLYAEDAMAGWRPSVGCLQRFSVPADGGSDAVVRDQGPVVRLDSGVEDGSMVSPWYDPMLAKVIAWAPTREEAARVLAAALRGARIHGVVTNRDLLVRILGHPDFTAGAIDTGFLVRHDPAELGAPLATADAEARHAVAAALCAQAARRAEAAAGGVLGTLPSGWRNNPSQPERVAFTGHRGRIEVAYRFDRRGADPVIEVTGHDIADGAGGDDLAAGSRVDLAVGDGGGSGGGGGNARAERHVLLACDPASAVLESNGVRRRYAVDRVGDTTWVDGPDGSSVLVEEVRFPLSGAAPEEGSMLAPLPGTVVKVAVATGQVVAAGDLIVAIEAMKMEHEVRAAHAGTVAEVLVVAGDQVDAGRVLVVVHAEETATVASGRGQEPDPPTDAPTTGGTDETTTPAGSAPPVKRAAGARAAGAKQPATATKAAGAKKAAGANKTLALAGADRAAGRAGKAAGRGGKAGGAAGRGGKAGGAPGQAGRTDGAAR